jgi:protein tyrosine/serine phosphatase
MVQEDMAQEINFQSPPLTEATTRQADGKRRGRRAMRTTLIVLAVIMVVLWAIGVFGGNVHTVVPGQVYRSAQLTGFNYTALTAGWIGHDFDSVVNADHIKTVINLRGGSPNNDYYRDEVAECDRLGLAHMDVPLSATHLPPPDRMRLLLSTFDHARYPILLHCQGGSDRTGLASALYLHLYKQVPLDQALQQQLTWRYGHFSFTKTRAMDRFFALYQQTGHGLTLRQWILQDYPAVYANQPDTAIHQDPAH